MDYADIPDKIDPKIFKTYFYNQKIPSDRFFDIKTRTIIDLPDKPISDSLMKKYLSIYKSSEYVYLDQIHFQKKIKTLILRK